MRALKYLRRPGKAVAAPEEVKEEVKVEEPKARKPRKKAAAKKAEE